MLTYAPTLDLVVDPTVSQPNPVFASTVKQELGDVRADILLQSLPVVPIIPEDVDPEEFVAAKPSLLPSLFGIDAAMTFEDGGITFK